MRFNPPPNWPRSPDGWSPPPGWQPDPSWSQPPWGWPLWVDDDETFVLSRSRSALSPMQLPWYKRTVTVVLFLIFFFPVGLVFLWLREDWSVRRRGIVTAAVAVFVIIAMASSNPAPPTTVQLSPGPAAGLSSSSPQPSSATSSPPALPAAQPSQSAPATSTSPKSSTSTHAAIAAPVTVKTTAARPAPITHAPPPPPPPPATTRSAPQPPSTCGAPSNPYGYNFCGTGSYVTSPPSDVCSYFSCIDNFWNGRGYMVECRDGTYSMSGGIRGACSDHGGEDQPVYSG